MIDIDNFKQINDSYDHDIGDKVLVALANILKSYTSPMDIVARFGGEEFCILLKNINRYSALEIYEKLRTETELFRLPIDKERTINFTISIGATLYNTDESIDENIDAADMLLYKAKQAGKNQLIFE